VGVQGYVDERDQAWESSGDTTEDNPLTAGATSVTVNDVDALDAYGRGAITRSDLVILQQKLVARGAPKDRSFEYLRLTQTMCVSTVLRTSFADNVKLWMISGAALLASAGVSDYDRLVRLFWTQAQTSLSTEGAGDAAIPKSPTPGFVLAFALGSAITLLRKRACLSVEEVAEHTSKTSAPIKASVLVRVENGTASRSTPIGPIALVLRTTESKLSECASEAVRFAGRLAEKTFRASGEDWFAQVVTLYGEDAARALVIVGVASALRARMDGGGRA
jgi:hypothetical protein